MRYNYATRSIEFNEKKEFAFGCATKDRETKELNLHFISDPYTLKLNSEDHVTIRFVCLVVDYSHCNLVAMAEMSAITFASPEFPVEEIYLRMRKYYNRGKFLFLTRRRGRV